MHPSYVSWSAQVMDAGVAAEYDTPASLLANSAGIFTSMVNETGKATAAFLQNVAAGTADISGPAAAAAAAGASIGAAEGGPGEDTGVEARGPSAAGTPAVSRSGSVAQNGLFVAQKVLREAVEADQLLRHLVHFMEDKARLFPRIVVLAMAAQLNVHATINPPRPGA